MSEFMNIQTSLLTQNSINPCQPDTLVLKMTILFKWCDKPWNLRWIVHSIPLPSPPSFPMTEPRPSSKNNLEIVSRKENILFPRRNAAFMLGKVKPNYPHPDTPPPGEHQPCFTLTVQIQYSNTVLTVQIQSSDWEMM